jgi:spermidine synthase
LSVGPSLLVFALGFTALLAQTLLFRDFLTAFEGNEIGVGSFFGSWFLWIAVGALLARARPRTANWLVPLTLLYLPAFAIEHESIRSIRAIAGVASYEVFPFRAMLLLSVVTNAPVSLVTGGLFTLACRWWEWRASPGGLPVARVFVLETLGAAAGGAAVTAMLARGWPGPTAFLVGSVVLVAAVAATGSGRVLRYLPLAALLAAHAAGIGPRWAEADALGAWTRLLPEDTYRGRFATPQAEYLHGEREGQFLVMSGGGVVESLPDDERGGEITALALSQHPETRRALVVGPGSLAICRQLRELPRITDVTWLHPDPSYPAELAGILPEPLRADLAGLDIPGLDVRDHLRSGDGRYDLVLLNLPDATTLVLNRYFTREFLTLLKERLEPDGVVAVRITGAANFLGGELAFLGGSALATLRASFDRVALKPGDESWLFASDGTALSESPALLRDRFAALEGADRIFPPDGILSLVPPDRIAFQYAKYREAAERAGPEMLVNTDDRPKALLFALLVSLRQAGVKGLTRIVSALLSGGVWMLAGAILLYPLLRLGYVLTDRSIRARRSHHGFDAGALVFATGLVGMALSVWLMFAYQSRFGSLFLHVGLLSALFMLGSFGGALTAERALRRWTDEPPALLPGILAVHVVAIAGIVAVAGDSSPALFGLSFGIAGLLTGVYFPIAAHRLRAAGRESAESGAVLETVDHLGAAAGAVLTGLFLLPLFGGTVSGALLALPVAIQLPIALVRRGAPISAEHGDPADRADRFVRAAGYTIFGIGAAALLASGIAAGLRRGQEGERLLAAAHEMAGGEEPEPQDVRPADGPPFRYWKGTDPEDASVTLVFSSAGLAEGIHGYGGPLTLGVAVSSEGELRGFKILRSRETPAYLELLHPWRDRLLGRDLFASEVFRDVDGVTGATLTSNAILATLSAAGRGFASRALGREIGEPAPPRTERGIDPSFAWVAAFLAAAILVRFRPGRWRRRGFLLAAFLVLGLQKNLQYSSHHVFSLLGGTLPAAGASAAFLLVVGVPVLTLLVGNVYCGWVCPFGALQELVGELRPRRLVTDPEKGIWRTGRLVKYGLLFLLVLSFALTRDPSVLAADPLTTFYGAVRRNAVWVVGVGAIALSIPFRRFWCRNLCPAGAFLSLLNLVRLVRKLSPATQPGRCDLGVRNPRELDCLRCDRCFHATD